MANEQRLSILERMPHDLVQKGMRDMFTSQDFARLSMTSSHMRASTANHEDAVQQDAILSMIRTGSVFHKKIADTLREKIIHDTEYDDTPTHIWKYGVLKQTTETWKRCWGSRDALLAMGYLMRPGSDSANKFIRSVDKWVDHITSVIQYITRSITQCFTQNDYDQYESEDEGDGMFNQICRRVNWHPRLFISGCMKLFNTKIRALHPNFMRAFCPRATASNGNYIPPFIDYWEMYDADTERRLLFLGDKVFDSTSWDWNRDKKEAQDAPDVITYNDGYTGQNCIIRSILDGSVTFEQWKLADAVRENMIGDVDHFIGSMAKAIAIRVSQPLSFAPIQEIMKVIPEFFTRHNLEFLYEYATNNDDFILDIVQIYPYQVTDNLYQRIVGFRALKHYVPEASHLTFADAVETYNKTLFHEDSALIKACVYAGLSSAYDDVKYPASVVTWDKMVFPREEGRPALVAELNAVRATLRMQREDINPGARQRQRLGEAESLD